MALFAVFLLHLLFLPQLLCWNDGAVLLRDVQVLTLYRGRYTTARRSSPVPQLKCLGGTAGCSAFLLDVVQCQNKGWDGVDVQWECKADMDNWYRFGRIEVSCEGYNSPDDPYILKGSCGLEYTLELTSEGRQNQGSSPFSDFTSGFFGGKQKQYGGDSEGHFPSGLSGGGPGSLVVIGIFLFLAYAIYKMFLCNPTHGQHENGHQGPDGFHNNGPPPPGFKPDFTNEANPPGYGFADSYTNPNPAGFGGGQGGFGQGVFGQGLGGLGQGLGGLGGLGQGFGGQGRRGGGGFWSGMGTGGLLGYLFGSQRRGPTVGGAYPTYHHTTSPKPSTSSSGTRTASGFGGTKRR